MNIFRLIRSILNYPLFFLFVESSSLQDLSIQQKSSLSEFFIRKGRDEDDVLFFVT